MKNMNRTIIAGTGFIFLMTARHGLAQDWPQWRGVNRDGKASGFTAPTTWPKELARIKVADTPTYAYPVVSGKRIFVQDQNAVTLYTVE